MAERADTGASAPDDDETPVVDAAAAALARARANAAEKGLRPGMRPAARRRPVGSSSTGRSPREGRDPRLIGDQLDRLVVDRGWKLDVAVGAVMGRWPEIVGPDIATHVVPVTFEGEVLTVRADSTAWATQMKLLTSTVLARIADEIGTGAVTELKVLGPSGPSWRRGARRSPDSRGPRDTYG